MEEQWQADRARLRKLRQAHPTWSQRRLAEETKRSVTWVKKWRKRLDKADPGDQEVLKRYQCSFMSKQRSRCPGPG